MSRKVRVQAPGGGFWYNPVGNGNTGLKHKDLPTIFEYNDLMDQCHGKLPSEVKLVELEEKGHIYERGSGFWKPNACGVTQLTEEAGIYDRKYFDEFVPKTSCEFRPLEPRKILPGVTPNVAYDMVAGWPPAKQWAKCSQPSVTSADVKRAVDTLKGKSRLPKYVAMDIETIPAPTIWIDESEPRLGRRDRRLLLK